MDRNMAEEMLLEAVRNLQEAARETQRAVSELDKQVSLINLKISMAAGGAALLATIIQRFMFP